MLKVRIWILPQLKISQYQQCYQVQKSLLIVFLKECFNVVIYTGR